MFAQIQGKATCIWFRKWDIVGDVWRIEVPEVIESGTGGETMPWLGTGRNGLLTTREYHPL